MRESGGRQGGQGRWRRSRWIQNDTAGDSTVESKPGHRTSGRKWPFPVHPLSPSFLSAQAPTTATSFGRCVSAHSPLLRSSLLASSPLTASSPLSPAAPPPPPHHFDLPHPPVLSLDLATAVTRHPVSAGDEMSARLSAVLLTAERERRDR